MVAGVEIGDVGATASSIMLGEALRAQVARLPEMPKPQQLDTEMAQLRVSLKHHGIVHGWISTPCIALLSRWNADRKSTRLNSSHVVESRMPSSA